MTPEERAEKIMSRLAENRRSWERMDGIIVAEICAAMDEAICKSRIEDDRLILHWRPLVEKVRDEALEEAANFIANTPGNSYARDCDHQVLADDIRALKSKP